MAFCSQTWLPISLFVSAIQFLEKQLFVLVKWYDIYIYTPIERFTSPVVSRIPRYITFGEHQYVVFSANIVSWVRTLLVVPIAIYLKCGHFSTCFWLVILHDYLDHVDGIVARVQREHYGPVDDPILGGFMDAFCDKIVNVFALWTILLVSDFSLLTPAQCWVLFLSCAVIIVYEFTLGVVRVQDYFHAHYARLNKKFKKQQPFATAAVMEGKLKEKLESLGIAFLALAQGAHGVLNYWSGVAGVVCLVLSIRLAHASLSRKLEARIKETKGNKSHHKINASLAAIDLHEKEGCSHRPLYNDDGSKKVYHRKKRPDGKHKKIEENEDVFRGKDQEGATENFSHLPYSPGNTGVSTFESETDTETDTRRSRRWNKGTKMEDQRSVSAQVKPEDFINDESGNSTTSNDSAFVKDEKESDKSSGSGSSGKKGYMYHGITVRVRCSHQCKLHRKYSTGSDTEEDEKALYRIRRRSLPNIDIDGRVDKIYSIGCFDLFHRGHVAILQKMRNMGKQVIVGVHDSRSYYKLKNKVPIDPIEKRMLNVKQYADVVYCITSTDPSNFISCIVHLCEGETALYIRGDDMQNFPSRHVVEALMPIRFLPYTQGVSSTKIRKELFARIRRDSNEWLSDGAV
ncbi:uncharacterized protein LOC106155363 [Lingula anatina]|uniref:Uncharacterized protein LOC106155363 n=1 Tax=Lingula anatina TaxID=7574 RepID=A0A1S3HHW6_LINAN|nr:uncharacterized protein LOC106155363 [Lingula anatina]|eukprot:XP_013385612.1 uncharacterized protein LOC106155363 [Lingula anatina]